MKMLATGAWLQLHMHVVVWRRLSESTQRNENAACFNFVYISLFANIGNRTAMTKAGNERWMLLQPTCHMLWAPPTPARKQGLLPAPATA
jgi:hypothetical protein